MSYLFSKLWGFVHVIIKLSVLLRLTLTDVINIEPYKFILKFLLTLLKGEQ